MLMNSAIKLGGGYEARGSDASSRRCSVALEDDAHMWKRLRLGLVLNSLRGCDRPLRFFREPEYGRN